MPHEHEHHPVDPQHERVVADAMARHGREPAALLPIFHTIQDRLGFVPPAGLGVIAKALNVSHADVHGVLTFYHDFRTTPPGRHVVKICRAEACQAVGCETLVSEARERLGVGLGETRADGALTLEPVYCLGNCALGPSALVDGEILGRATVDRIESCMRAGKVSS